MTLHLDSSTIKELCDEEVAYQAAQLALDAQRAGRHRLPPRIDVNVPTGFFRAMPAALGDYLGAKIMTLAKGVGNRYLLLVYRQETGELLATLDAAEVTRLRTAATTALAGRLLCPGGTDVLGLIGTGFEAEGHLRAFARLWPLTKVLAFSRSAERRQAFAARMSADLGIDVVGVDDAGQAISSPVTVLCTKATEPVVDGDGFAPGSVVLSIGSTRPDLRELDDATFARARRVLVDDVTQVLAESGDVASALAAGAVTADALVSMPDWDPLDVPSESSRDLLVFKSVGTALQDLALGAALIAGAQRRGLGRDLGEITELKKAKERN
jgi:ornithine cyclodeaminase/alanine dehydrogenase-like protein (mu-crystallin family)